MTDLEKLDYLIARAEVSDAVSRYPITIDTRDWEGFRAIFTDQIDILLTMAARRDRPRQIVNADSFTDAVEKVITSFSLTQHFLTHYKIEIKGDAATCLSYMYARHMPPAERPSQAIWDVGGFYEFQLRRTSAGWKVPKYTLILTWETGRPENLAIDL